MDVANRLLTIRDEIKLSAESLLRAAKECDAPEEMEHLNAVLQAHRQNLNSAAYLLGLALQERGGKA